MHPILGPWLRLLPTVRALRHGATLGGLFLAGAGCGALLLSLWLSRTAPAWWRSVSPEDPRTIQRAEAVEQGVMNHAAMQRPAPAPGEPGTVWTVALSAADANAWLNVRLPKWLANREEPVPWPAELDELQVEFEGGAVHVGARVRASGSQRVLSATLVPRVEPDGSLWVPARAVSVGRLAVPAGWVLGEARARARARVPEALRQMPEAAAMFLAFEGRAPLVSNAVLRLGDGRRVRLLDLRARDGRLEITCRTEAPETSG